MSNLEYLRSELADFPVHLVLFLLPVTLNRYGFFLLSILALVGLLTFELVLFLFYTPRKLRMPKGSPQFIPAPYAGLPGLIENPLVFVAEKHKELGTRPFSTCLLGRRWSFIAKREDVESIMKAEDDVMSFSEAYQPLIKAGFGHGILTPDKFKQQVKLLTDNLTVQKLESYMAPSRDLARRIVMEHVPSAEGEADLELLLQKAAFAIGSRNLLDDKFPPILAKFPFTEISSTLDVGKRIASMIIPGMEDFTLWWKRNITGRTPYEEEVFRLMNQIGSIETPNTVLQEIVKFRHDPEGPTQGSDWIANNLSNFFVVGTSLNSYNMMVYAIRRVIANPELWKELRDEQVKVDTIYGPDIVSQGKLDAMEKLKALISKALTTDSFPFLLRVAKRDFPLSDGTVIPAGDIVAFSPRHQVANGLDISFGLAKHVCPAMKYSWNSMRIVLSEVIKRIESMEVISAPAPENKRLITFPIQPKIIVSYKA